MRIGYAFLGEPDVRGMLALAQRAEAAGYESVWIAETRLAREAIVPAAAIAAVTQRIQIATGCINVFTRGAMLTAVTFATLDDLSGGRAILGIATGSPLVLQSQGYDFDQPLVRLREYVEAIRALLAEGRVSYAGRTLRIPEAVLNFERPRRTIPVYLGVTGPKALKLAGEIADGVLLNGFMSVEYVGRARERIAAGEKRAGRPIGSVDVAMAIDTALDRDGEAARHRMRALLATYLTGFPHIARESGLEAEYLERLGQAVREEGVESAARLVGDEILDSLVSAGTPEHCRARILAYRDAGVTLPVVSAVGPDFGLTLDELAPECWDSS